MTGRSSVTSWAVPTSTAEVHAYLFLTPDSELFDIQLTAPGIVSANAGGLL